MVIRRDFRITLIIPSDLLQHLFAHQFAASSVKPGIGKYAISSINGRYSSGAGPYHIAKNLGGTEKGYFQVVYSANNQPGAFPINNTLHISSNPSYAPGGVSNISSLDFGADVLLGFSYKRFDFSASFNRGFSDVYHTTYTDLGHQFWNFTVGYVLSGHPRKPKL